MTDYTTKTDAELDALAADRMGWEWSDETRGWVMLDGTVWRDFKPTTDANDRDEWFKWLWRHPRAARIEIVWGGAESVVLVTLCKAMERKSGRCCGHLGPAAVIAGLRATDD